MSGELIPILAKLLEKEASQPAAQVNEPSPLAQVTAQANTEFATPMPAESRDQKILLYGALHGDHKEIKSVLNTEISIVGFVLRASEEQTSNDGQVYRYPISVLILSDGSYVRAGSLGVIKCLKQLSELEPSFPWSPPIRVIPRSRECGDGRQWIYLELVKDQPRKAGK